MAAVAALTAATLSACSDDDATGAEGTPSAAETTTSAEPSAVETTEAPTPTESESSQWTAEEAALIEEAEAFYLEAFARLVAVRQASYADGEAAIQSQADWGGEGRESWIELKDAYEEFDLRLEGEPIVLSIQGQRVEIGEQQVRLAVCTDFSETDVLLNEEVQPDLEPGVEGTIVHLERQDHGPWWITGTEPEAAEQCD